MLVEFTMLSGRSRSHSINKDPGCNGLHLGDKNTAFFHRSVLHRRHRNGIYSLRNENGEEVRDLGQLGKMAASQFEHLLSYPQPGTIGLIADIFSKTISHGEGEAMQRPISNEEIREALFSILDDKAPGTDGYNSFFFKNSWAIIEKDFT